ncbi:MAG TPA: acylphosphatase [Thermotogota bacterium]|nr:acylphosphatase [Thermotogota bacterium]HNY82632.1 acylphosphatase [Thermotogota bacterium]HOD90999.1 acylphosphatase [Thermotogota bacterium]HOH13500.1 acylphosphatase [Thermotogota bacterium]HPD35212.1 acylphosphatase [Thermotogota bacterium]
MIGAMLTYRYLIKGVVQGVGYRHFVVKMANQLGIKGTVRNLSTGEVEVYASLSEERVRIFENLLQEGPFLSRVEEVLRESAEGVGPFEGFSVLF